MSPEKPSPPTQYSPGNMAPGLSMPEVIEGYNPAPYVMPDHLTKVVMTPAGRPTQIPAPPPVEAAAPVTVTIDGHEVTIPAGSTILEACRAQLDA